MKIPKCKISDNHLRQLYHVFCNNCKRNDGTMSDCAGCVLESTKSLEKAMKILEETKINEQND